MKLKFNKYHINIDDDVVKFVAVLLATVLFILLLPPPILHAKPLTMKPFDIDKLAYAVSVAETGGCTKGVARLNNCFGIMVCNHGRCHPKAYKTKQESFEEFKSMWMKKYGVFPTQRIASCYVTGCRSKKPYPKQWLDTVTKSYNQPQK